MDFDIEELRRRLPTVKQIATDLYGVRWRNNRATCPRGENHTHGDKDPSFRYLPRVNRVHCFSQRCFGEKPVDAFDFVSQMENCDFQEAARKLADRYGIGPKGGSAQSGTRNSKKLSAREQLLHDGWLQVAEYEMGDGIRKVRFEHPGRIQADKNRPEKTFLWEHRTPDGNWKSGRAGRPHLAYANEPFRQRDQLGSVLGVESERSADAAGTIGIPAFSIKEITSNNAVAVAGMDLFLLPDKDDEGSRLVNEKLEFLRPHARSISLINPPSDWPAAGDLYDAIAEMGWTRSSVEALLATAQPVAATKAKAAESAPASAVWSLAELRVATFPAPEPIVEGIISAGETIGLIGKPKAGKSRLAQQLALSVSSGSSFLGQAVPKARKVLILDLENRPAGVRARFQMMSQASAGDERLLIYAPETLSNVEITLATPAGLKALLQLIKEIRPDLLIVDTWRLLLAGDENKTEVVVRGLRALSSLRQLLPALAIIIVHHTRKMQGKEQPLLRIDPSAWVENASGHYALVAHVDACFGLEREIDKSGDELIVFGGVSRSAAPATLLLDEDPDTLMFRTSDGDDIVQKLLTNTERSAWQAVSDMREFNFSDVVERAHTKNRKLVASLLRKLTTNNIVHRGLDKVYRRPAKGRN